MAESLPHLRERVAEIVGDDAARQVLKVVADEVGDYTAGLMDGAIQQVLRDDEGGFSATLRAAAATSVANLLRAAAECGDGRG
ncbi:hypothetical protein [Actinomadura litoris]|uniref:hypothetical protein n=1 Tax=Actinomadura litoris TaxID=2678616 RepID=UPI001FA76A99|nr:hypothetical protein [Actinomadura litoris]